MPTTSSFPAARFRAAFAALIALCLLVALAPAEADAAKVQTFRHAAKQGTVVTYRLKNVKPATIKKARLSARKQRQALSLGTVRKAARKGVLKVRVRRTLLRRSAAAAATIAPTLVLVVDSKPITINAVQATGVKTEKRNPKPALKPVADTTAPAPAPAPLPTGVSGSCAFGTFGAGVVPGACWRPYSDDSPFNRRLPVNPPVLGNSTGIVQRILNFGPIAHLRPGVAGTEQDSGDPVYWSQPTDPAVRIHCEDEWGTCAVEGDIVRIPREAKPAGASDGHMSVVDQVTGIEYDFWAVRTTQNTPGQLNIGWGGKTSIHGDGLESDATAARFGSMAGKLRVEELEAGRINHALFLAMGCDSGTYVYPAKKTGLKCSDTTNAPAMGSHVMLDMTPEQIDALSVPSWKKTILRALAEYGAFFGDTGGSMTIAEESGLSHTAFGQEDKWEAFAKANGVPYYAPDDVYVMNIRDGVDWQRHLRVVDPCVSQRTC